MPLGMIAFLDFTALVTTVLHPIGFVLGIVAVAAFIWFAVALGTYVSLRSRNTTQAITQTGLILLAINLGPALVLYRFMDTYQALIVGGCTPTLLSVLPMSWLQFAAMRHGWPDPFIKLGAAAVLGVIFAHALAARFLTRECFGGSTVARSMPGESLDRPGTLVDFGVKFKQHVLA